MPWDQLGKRGQEKSRKALISLGFTAFLGLPGKTNWWSRGEVNPTMDLQKILINHTLADFLVEGFAAPALHKLPPIDAWRLEYFMLTGVATNLTIRSANAAEMNLERAALTMLAI
ncbi:hypothetical protein [Pseudomonas monteilii]|uniref:hypothetical protein n=1 Tax=Pseudomonas monteilii TaxID=76759 RepID=UPI0012DA8E25|nr:hypothetical protein [Pseudomonas monteilii]